MKTPLPPPDGGFIRRAALAAVLFAGIVFGSITLPRAVAALSGPKDHVLFVGTDLAVQEGGRFYHVIGAAKDSLKIEKDHRLEDVHLGKGVSVRISKGVKLSNLSATISDVKTESVDRASARAQLEAMKSTLLMQEEAAMQSDRLESSLQQAQSEIFNNDPTSYGYKESKAAADANKVEAMNNYAGGIPGLNLLSDSANTYLMHHVREQGQTEVELSFDVASREPLDHAYLVVVANYGGKDGNTARQISARAFEHIDSQPQHVTMSHAASLGGLPFAKFDVALFADGQEVATNLSEKRMPLTTDEAYNFFLIDYLSAHKDATLAPTPMLMTPRAEFRREVEHADTKQPIYATVDKMGRVLAISANEAGTAKVPGSIESALQDVRFMPALSKGVPVEGRIRVTLAQLAN